MKHLPNSQWDEVRTAYASGVGLRELARNMGIPAGTVLARAKRERWTQRIAAAKANAATPRQPVAVTTMQAVAISMQERGERHIGRMAGITERVMPHLEAMDPDLILHRVDEVEKLDKIARRTFKISEEPTVGVSIQVLSLNSAMM